MGTRALVDVVADDHKAITARIYRHWDGYPSGLGLELIEYCLRGQTVNGLGRAPALHETWNGAGCFAASLIVHLKNKPGDIYLEPVTSPDTEGRWETLGAEYIYTIDPGRPVPDVRIETIERVYTELDNGDIEGGPPERKHIMTGSAAELLHRMAGDYAPGATVADWLALRQWADITPEDVIVAKWNDGEGPEVFRIARSTGERVWVRPLLDIARGFANVAKRVETA